MELIELINYRKRKEQVQQEAEQLEAAKGRIRALKSRLVELEALSAERIEAHRAQELHFAAREAELRHALHLRDVRAAAVLATVEDRQKPIGVVGTAPVGTPQPHAIIAEAARAGVTYGKGLAAYTAERYPEKLAEVLALASGRN